MRMRDRLLCGFLLLLFAVFPAFGQGGFTTVSGAIVDPNGIPWAGGTISAQLITQGGTAPTLNGQPFTSTTASGLLGPGGTFTMRLGDNGVIVPSTTTWQFTISIAPGVLPPAGKGPQSFSVTTAINCGTNTPASCTSNSMTITSTLAPVPALAFGGGTPTPVPGTFNSNFDPPLFQNYSITTAGAQTGLSEVGNSIDTHILNWQPSSSPGVGDAFAYANGDLHTSNANWVYQTGTFTVTNNVVYSSSAGNDLAYRSDFTATTNQYAQATVLLTGSVGTQVTGPCVRVQTGAQTAYCLELGNDSLILAIDNAGALSTLQNYGAILLTGDLVKIEAIGTTLKVYRNGVCLAPCGVTNAVIASGQIGIFGAASGTVNGLSNFQGGIASICNIQVDSASDSINGPWTANGVIPSQSCTYPGSFQVSNIRANFIRVNVTSLTGGVTLSVNYAGRLAPSLPGTGFSGVSNGVSVNAGEVVWSQFTSQGNLGPIAVQTWIRVLLSNGTTYSNGPAGTTIGGCSTGASPGGVGFGIIIPFSGILQSVITQVNTPGFPQGSFYINDYLLTELPTGGVSTGTTNTCTNALAAANPNAYFLTGGIVGSFYPVSFTGATSIISSPWSIPGFTTTTAVSNPAAGADWSNSPQTSARTCIQGVSFTLTTSAGVANRLPVLVFTLNGSKMVYAATTAQTASTTQTYSFSPGATAETVTGGSTVFHIVPFNNGQLVCFNSGLSTFTISTLTTALQAADQYSNISILTQVQQDNN